MALGRGQGSQRPRWLSWAGMFSSSRVQPPAQRGLSLCSVKWELWLNETSVILQSLERVCFLHVSAGAVKLTSLTCGNQHVWACDSRGGVYFRVGTQPLNPSLMLPAWITIEPPVQVSTSYLIPSGSTGRQRCPEAVAGGGAHGGRGRPPSKWGRAVCPVIGLPNLECDVCGV